MPELPDIVVYIEAMERRVKGEKNVVLKERTPLANVHCTILEKLGIGTETFGNSTGIVAEA